MAPEEAMPQEAALDMESEPEPEEPPMVPRFATFQPEPEAMEPEPTAPDPAPPPEPPAPPEPPPERKGWTVRSIVGTPPASRTPDESPENPPEQSEQANEEFEKIRRILRDLD